MLTTRDTRRTISDVSARCGFADPHESKGIRDSIWIGALVALCLVIVPATADADTAYTAPLKAEDQLANDHTSIPRGSGALFVPSLTDPSREPLVQVFSGGVRVASAGTAERIVLPPATYLVYIGHGPIESRPAAEVVVSADQTTIVPPFFAALDLSVVTAEGVASERTYTMRDNVGGQIYRPDDRDFAGVWLVPVGSVTIALGDDDDAESGSVVVPTFAGSVLHYRLVESDGALVRTELATSDPEIEEQLLRLRWSLGGDFVFTQATHQLGAYNGTRIQGGIFSALEVGLDAGFHLLVLTFDLSASWFSFDPSVGISLPISKVRDDAFLELLYAYRLARIVGLYGRAAARASMFPTEIRAEGELEVVAETGESLSILGAGDAFELMREFAPLFVQTGVGVMVTPIDSPVLTLGVGVGGALRWAFFGDGRAVLDVESDRVVTRALEDRFYYGGEVRAEAGLRITRWFSLDVFGTLFLPSGQLVGDEALRPIFRVNGTAGLHLRSWASLLYSATVHSDDPQIPEVQVLHNIALRFQYAIF